MRTTTCLLALSLALATGHSSADELPANAAQAVSLAVDFCGAIVGAKVDVSVRVEEQDIVIVTVGRSGGWWW